MRTIGNILWLVLCGAWIALGWLFWGLILADKRAGACFDRLAGRPGLRHRPRRRRGKARGAAA